jgi:hypothetical protein
MEIEQMADAQVDFYVNQCGGCCCPFCESGNIEGNESIQADDGVAWQEVICLDRKSLWNDLYTLTGVEKVVE